MKSFCKNTLILVTVMSLCGANLMAKHKLSSHRDEGESISMTMHTNFQKGNLTYRKIPLTMTVAELKQVISHNENIPAREITILYGKRKLEDNALIGHYYDRNNPHTFFVKRAPAQAMVHQKRDRRNKRSEGKGTQ